MEDTAWSAEDRAGSFTHEGQQGLTLKSSQHGLIHKKRRTQMGLFIQRTHQGDTHEKNTESFFIQLRRTYRGS
jgi:hypothetical protein